MTCGGPSRRPIRPGFTGEIPPGVPVRVTPGPLLDINPRRGYQFRSAVFGEADRPARVVDPVMMKTADEHEILH